MFKVNKISISLELKKQFQSIIFIWGSQHIINYPWRENRNPYKVLVSEILLIRTRASQVSPIFKEFMIKYPSLEEFLNSQSEIIKQLFSSLGLHFRARFIEAIKTKIKKDYNNEIPNNIKDLKSLKGLGNYSANAILCFGFNQRRALLDTNFIKIYKRVFNVQSKIKTPKNDKYLWEFSEFLLPEKNFVRFNYSILDLGGIICKHRNPQCNICPLGNVCYFNNLN